MAYITFELEDGTKVLIESTDGHKNSPGLIPAGKAAEAADNGAISFEQQIDGARKMSAAMMKKFREGFGTEPSDIDITFGLKASSDTSGFLISRAGPESTFSISLHWRERDKNNEKKSE